MQKVKDAEVEQPQISPFEEVKTMTDIQALNILIQAANAAQGAGALSVRDSVFVAAAAELLTKPYVLLKFSAEWCLPCKRIQPLFEKLSNEN